MTVSHQLVVPVKGFDCGLKGCLLKEVKYTQHLFILFINTEMSFLLQLFHFCLVGFTLTSPNSAILSAQKAFPPTVVSSQFTH